MGVCYWSDGKSRLVVVVLALLAFLSVQSGDHGYEEGHHEDCVDDHKDHEESLGCCFSAFGNCGRCGA